jgi:hypothetical protein
LHTRYGGAIRIILSKQCRGAPDGKQTGQHPDHRGVIRLSENFEVDALQTRPAEGQIASQKAGRHLRFNIELIDGWLGVWSQNEE